MKDIFKIKLFIVVSKYNRISRSQHSCQLHRMLIRLLSAGVHTPVYTLISSIADEKLLSTAQDSLI